jgi:hypothetical protein
MNAPPAGAAVAALLALEYGYLRFNLHEKFSYANAFKEAGTEARPTGGPPHRRKILFW